MSISLTGTESTVDITITNTTDKDLRVQVMSDTDAGDDLSPTCFWYVNCKDAPTDITKVPGGSNHDPQDIDAAGGDKDSVTFKDIHAAGTYYYVFFSGKGDDTIHAASCVNTGYFDGSMTPTVDPTDPTKSQPAVFSDGTSDIPPDFDFQITPWTSEEGRLFAEMKIMKPKTWPTWVWWIIYILLALLVIVGGYAVYRWWMERRGAMPLRFE